MFGRKRLARENAILRNALAWYADSSNWKRCAIQAAGEPRRWAKSAAAFDRGARALFALTQADAPDRAAWSEPVVIGAPVFLSAATSGGVTSAAPSAAGNVHTSPGPSARRDLERIVREGATQPAEE
jgi:hypothetical protein